MEILDPIPTEERKVNHLSEFFIFIGIAMVSIFVFAIIGGLICSNLYGVSLEEISAISTLQMEHPQASKIHKISQTFSLFGMIAGALTFLLTTRKHIFSYLSLKKEMHLLYVILSILLVITLLPLVSYVVNINSGIAESLGYSSKNLMGVYELLASSNSTIGFIFSIFLMSVLPAVAEEFLFRGVLQTLLKKWSKSSHLAIIITSLIFAVIHSNPEQILGILLLGLILGYLFELTGNLIYPIILHASNNLLSVIGMKYAEGNKVFEALANDYSPNLFVVLISVLFTSSIFVFLYKTSLKKEHE